MSNEDPSETPHPTGENADQEETEGGGEHPADPSSETLRKALQNRRAKSAGDEQKDLTPEEQEASRKSFETVRRAVNPLANIKLPTYTFPKMPQIGLSPAVVKNLTGASGIYDRVAKSYLPGVQIQQNWVKNMGIINSDFMKNAGLLQTQPLIQRLMKGVDFGGFNQYAKLAQVGARQASWFRDIIPNLDRLKAAFWPPNLRDIEDLDMEDVEAVVMLDGIGLYNVPRASIAQALIRADSAAKRREILGRRWKAISADCRDAMDGCKSKTLASYVPTAIAALDALDAGHTQAAQALVGSLTDSILIAYLGDDRYLYTPNRKTKDSEAYKKFGIRKFIALAPMWQAYQQFWAKNGDAVPTTFNRNATAHTVSSRQFNRRNAVQGLLFVCGLITFLDELAQVREASS